MLMRYVPIFWLNMGRAIAHQEAVELMQRLGFTYKKPQSMPAQADEAKQEAFTADYEALMPQH